MPRSAEERKIWMITYEAKMANSTLTDRAAQFAGQAVKRYNEWLNEAPLGQGETVIPCEKDPTNANA